MKARLARALKIAKTSLDFVLPGLVGMTALTIALTIAVSCAGTTQTIKTWTGSFVGCEKTDLGQLVTSEGIQTTLLGDVSALIQDNPEGLENDLEGLAAGLGMEAVHCAILASETALRPPMIASGSGHPNLRPRAELPGLVRAKTWLNKKQTSTTPKGSAQ